MRCNARRSPLGIQIRDYVPVVAADPHVQLADGVPENKPSRAADLAAGALHPEAEPQMPRFIGRPRPQHRIGVGVPSTAHLVQEIAEAFQACA
jgi:hypothetical protein